MRVRAQRREIEEDSLKGGVRLIQLLAALVLLTLASCGEPEDVVPDAHVRVDIGSNGMKAEVLRSQLLALGDDLKLAIIKDELAVIYSYLSAEDLGSLLDQHSDGFPLEFNIGEIQSVKGAIPSPPKQEEIETIEFVPNKEKIESLGIATSNIEALISAQIPSPESNILPDLDALASQPVRLPDGTTISIGELGQVKPVTVYRPLLITR